MTHFTLVVAVGPWKPEPWRKRFEAGAGGRRLHFWPQDGSVKPADPYVICAWKADPEVFDIFSAPQAVFSLGAGVDHLSVLGSRPEIPVYRVVDADLTLRMVEYVALGALFLHRQIPQYLAQQRASVWRHLFQRAATDVRVGIMGVGVMGEASGRGLQALGFDVVGWARRPKPTAPFPVMAGRDALNAFIEDTDILVNVLPRTPETERLVNQEVLARLGRNRSAEPGFINAGRGDTVVEADLIDALRAGRLSGAVLDVFEQEPLPTDSQLWRMENVLITPHAAADSNPETIIPQIMANVERLERGDIPARTVDMGRGY